MKKSSPELFATLSGSQIENLIREVKETSAAGFSHPVVKTFTITDLWSIQRQGKTRLQRRFY